MKYTCKDLKGQSFDTKELMFAALKKNKEALILLKKSAIKYSEPVSYTIKSDSVAKESGSPKKLEYGDTVYPVINSINYLDSHSDVHLRGIWDKSVEAQTGKVYFIINHELSLGNVISYPSDVEPMIKDVEWSKLGKTYPGFTQVLIFKTKITDKSNDSAFKVLRDGEDIEYSIRMQYVKLELAINDSGEGYKAEKAVFDKYLPLIVNQEKAVEDGFFWAVHEAKIYKEGSMVLAASNDATGTLYDLDEKEFQPLTSTENKEEEPPTSTQEREKSLMFNPNYI